MIEIPESYTIARQADDILKGKRIKKVIKATRPHKFAFYNGDPALYPALLTGRRIISAHGHGMFVDINFDEEVFITIGDGTNARFHTPAEANPEKHQLMLQFNDDSSLTFTVAMYGGIWAYKGIFENKYHRISLNSTSPLNDSFDESFFDNLINSVKKDLPVKALLATEQRIPGLGNGVLQDILFNAGVNPRLKKSAISDLLRSELFRSIKLTLSQMAMNGGRDTEKDLFGKPGGYTTILSKNTLLNPCPKCGNSIKKEAFLGGAVYYCPACQPINNRVNIYMQ